MSNESFHNLFSTSDYSSASNSKSNSLNRSLINTSLFISNEFCELTQRQRSRSLFTTKREEYLNLNPFKDEIYKLRKQLNEKDETIAKLNDIRERLESEIRDLTASLFEQAYAMVHEAKQETAQSNKKLNEANNKIDILEAEVNVLKSIVITSVPNTPNTRNTHNSSYFKHTTPITTLQTSLSQSKSNDLIGIHDQKYQKYQHKRTPSHNDALILTQRIQNSPNELTTSPELMSKCEIYEIDPIYFKEIVLWRENPVIDFNNSSFLNRVYNEDILPCINFNNEELKIDLLNSMQSNTVCIEDISKSHPIETMQICSLTNIPSICQYKIKFNELATSQWYLISKLCRNRIIAVCDFFSYLKYIKNGLVKSQNREVYWTIIDLRKRMALSRLGL